MTTIDGDALFFTRKVVTRKPCDPWEEIMLSCGHRLFVIPGIFGSEIDCGQCVNEYVDRERAKQ